MDSNLLSQAVALTAAGLSVKSAALKLHIPPATLARWMVRLKECGGDMEEALAPVAIGRPVVFAPNELELAIARWMRCAKESLNVAAYFFARDERVRPEIAAVILAVEEKALRTGKDEVWPDSVRRAFRVNAREKAEHQGKKHAQQEEMVTHRGMFEILEDGSHKDILPGETWELDDYSANQPFTFKDPVTGELFLGRQVLAARDLCSAKWLAFKHIGRERDAYRGEDIVRYIEDLCRTWGVPRRLRLERGSWESEAVHGIEVKGMSSRWGDLRDLMLIEHVFKSKGKSIVEGGFNVLQRWLAHTGIDIGRRRGDFEEATKRMRQAQTTGASPLDLGFLTDDESNLAHEEAARLINSRPMRRSHLEEKVSSDDLAQRLGWHTKPFSEEHAWYFFPCKVKRTVRAGSVEVSPGNGWPKVRFYLNGESGSVYFENGHQVLITYDPARPDLGARVCNGDLSKRNREGWNMGQCLLTGVKALPLAPQFNASGILTPHMPVRKKAAASTTFRAIRAAAGTHQPKATRETVVMDGKGNRASAGDMPRQDASQPDARPKTREEEAITAPIRSVHVAAPLPPPAWSSRAVPATREGKAAEIERLRAQLENSY